MQNALAAIIVGFRVTTSLTNVKIKGKHKFIKMRIE